MKEYVNYEENEVKLNYDLSFKNFENAMVVLKALSEEGYVVLVSRDDFGYVLNYTYTYNADLRPVTLHNFG